MQKEARKPFSKPALSPPDLLAHMRARGLQIADPVAALHTLEYVGYYRLLVYMRPFQRPDPSSGLSTFVAGTTFADVLGLYEFDRELRLLCLNAVERVEVALRAAIVTQVAVEHGPHFFLDPGHFERLGAFVEFYQTACREKRYLAVRHYENRYSEPELAPIWAIMESITYGALSRLFSGLRLSHRKAVAVQFGYDEKVLSSWFRSLNLVRNMCAHHNRLWNAPMNVDQPMAARKLISELARTDLLYARTIVLGELLSIIEPASEWKRRLVALICRYPAVPTAAMGFPPDWSTRAFWRVA
jgi:abortive infection bacteriophage resistance protein